MSSGSEDLDPDIGLRRSLSRTITNKLQVGQRSCHLLTPDSLGVDKGPPGMASTFSKV
jgi:hypothetical protein